MLEITESVAMENIDASLKVFDMLAWINRGPVLLALAPTGVRLVDVPEPLTPAARGGLSVV
jgi:hypothetical protein